ncbi:MAG: hypothetical protein ACREIW_00280 [Chthoniobacterales bacterium]
MQTVTLNPEEIEILDRQDPLTERDEASKACSSIFSIRSTGKLERFSLTTSTRRKFHVTLSTTRMAVGKIV